LIAYYLFSGTWFSILFTGMHVNQIVKKASLKNNLIILHTYYI